MAFIRTTKTASGATAVQVVEKVSGRLRVLHHIGSAHTPEELSGLHSKAKQILNNLPIERGQQDLFAHAEMTNFTQLLQGAQVADSKSVLLKTVLDHCYHLLAFDQITTGLFQFLVYARIIEPTSKLDSIRIIEELGEKASINGIYAMLARSIRDDYREALASRCLAYRQKTMAASLQFVLYDVTTLYFETSREDEEKVGPRKLGYSKDHRNDCPQIVIGLLVDQLGFPLNIRLYDGDTFEGSTLIPSLMEFKERLKDYKSLTVVADAGMLSADNLTKLMEAGFDYIVAARTGKLPDTQLEELTITSLKKDPGTYSEITTALGRLIMQYSEKRAQLDKRTRERQVQKAQAVIDGTQKGHSVKFAMRSSKDRTHYVFNTKLFQRAQQLEGLKGYLTSLHALPAAEIVAQYHSLWHVEKSFRMSKSDLRARPMFHHKSDSIEAHLTMVMAALALSRLLQEKTGYSIKRIINILRPLRSVYLKLNISEYQIHHIHPALNPEAEQIICKLGITQPFAGI